MRSENAASSRSLSGGDGVRTQCSLQGPSDARVQEVPSGRREAPFLIGLDRLRGFQQSRNRLPAPHAADAAEAELGRWLQGQIARTREGRLEALHSLLLEEALGAGWDEGAAPELRAGLQ